MARLKCLTFDKAGQDALSPELKAKMKADRDRARLIDSIGLIVTDVIAGTKVNYYPWFDKQTNTCADPVESYILTTEVFQVGREWTCKIKGVSGLVSINHLQIR